MGQVPKPLMIVFLTLIVCSYSQALQNHWRSARGSDPIHHDMEDAMKSEAYGIYQESQKGSDYEKVLINPIEKLQMDQIQYRIKWKVKEERTLNEFIEQL